MHASVMEWVAETVRRRRLVRRSVLDVGSCDVNGSVRGLFRGPYVGLDFRLGPLVDVQGDASALPFSAETFDVVVFTEVLEHARQPFDAVDEIRRVLRPGGVLLLTTRGIGFPLHEYPSDYWRFTVTGIEEILSASGFRRSRIEEDPQESGVFASAIR